jgi:hypothetical protein
MNSLSAFAILPSPLWAGGRLRRWCGETSCELMAKNKQGRYCEDDDRRHYRHGGNLRVVSHGKLATGLKGRVATNHPSSCGINTPGEVNLLREAW